MTKKQLYFVIGALAVVLLFVLFVPTGEKRQDTSSLERAKEVPLPPEEGALTQLQEEEVVTDTVADDLPEQVTLEGRFLSLVDGENQHGKTFKYMLLHDGSEVLRVDLRPLIGYSEIDVTQKLGVDREDDVRVIGIMEDGEFKVQSIAAQ